MEYVLTFVHSTAAYRAHSLGCSAAVSTRNKTRIDETFSSVSEAKSWADADESAKAEKPTAANFKACRCCG